MKHIKIAYIGPPYPVGSNIPRLMSVVENFKEGFLNLKYPKKTQFNLWCRGSSGAIIAALFTTLLPEYEFVISHVKKQGESSHSNTPEYLDGAINIIIDDFASSGQTIDEIIKQMPVEPNILIIAYGALSDIGYKQGWKHTFKYIISNN